MNEQLLADFLKGEATAEDLGPALLHARLAPDDPRFRTSANYTVAPLSQTVEVSAAEIDRLVAALEGGRLTAEQAGIAAFLLESAIERFIWDTDTPDGERVANVLFWLGMPGINYPLTSDNLAAMRLYLRTGEQTMRPAPRGAGA